MARGVGSLYADILTRPTPRSSALIGVTHMQCNGYHYADGLAGVPESKAAALLDAHPDVYHRAEGVARLTIGRGKVTLGSLVCCGFATAAEPNWVAMETMVE